MSDLIERLRERGGDLHATHGEHGAALCNEAADEIERLRRELAEARGLLKLATDTCSGWCEEQIDAFLTASDQPTAVQCKTCDGEGYVVNYRPGQAHAPKPCPDCTPDKSSGRANG